MDPRIMYVAADKQAIADTVRNQEMTREERRAFLRAAGMPGGGGATRGTLRRTGRGPSGPSEKALDRRARAVAEAYELQGE